MPSNKFSQKTEVYNTYTHIIRMHKWIYSRGVMKKHDKKTVASQQKAYEECIVPTVFKKIFIIQ